MLETEKLHCLDFCLLKSHFEDFDLLYLICYILILIDDISLLVTIVNKISDLKYQKKMNYYEICVMNFILFFHISKISLICKIETNTDLVFGRGDHRISEEIEINQ